MVKLSSPPPTSPANPSFEQLPTGWQLLRIFDPTRYNTGALTFRYYGRISRFDHHRQQAAAGQTVHYPQHDPERGIYYAAFKLECCIVEVFGDTRVIESKGQQLAFVRLIRPIKLLDLRSPAAMMAGTVFALSMTDDRNKS